MSLLPNFRARLKEALGERLEEWRPGVPGHAEASEWDASEDFVADPEPAREPAPRPASRYSADAPWAAPVSDAPTSRDAAVAAPGSRAALLARLRAPDALREAFVVKEILDRPVSLRPLRGPGIRG